MKKNTIIVSALLIAGLAGLTGCGNEKKSAAVPAINLDNMDLTVLPGEDFYMYCNGGWKKNNPLPAQESRWGVFDKLGDTSLEQVHAIVEEVMATESEPGSIAQKITTMYKLGMDSVKLNAEGAAPIKEQLAQIEAIKDGKELAGMIASMHREGIFPYFYTFVDSDEKNSSMNVFTLYQAGIGMGDRDYYLLQDEDTKAIRAAYEEYIRTMFTLAGYSAEQAEAGMEAVLKIENKIADASYSREVLRDTYRNYNKLTGRAWAKVNSMIDWNTYFEALGMAIDDDLVVKQKDFFMDLAKTFKGVTLEEQKLYLAYNLISAAAPFLSDDFVNANFEFYGRAMSGSQEIQPRWKRALSTTDGALSEALGQLYVEKYFPASSKEKMLELVHNIQVALSERINSLAWMSEETKARAQQQIAAVVDKRG